MFWMLLLFFTNLYREPSIENVISGVVFLMSLLVHEYGHALTALYFGARPTITLEGFGGAAQYNGKGFTPMQHFLITLNGPLFESLLIVVSYSLLKLNLFDNYYVQYFLYVTMRINIFWCLLNLIPVAPLDGGHLVRYFLEKKFGEKGHLASILIGFVAIACVAPFLFFEGFFFFGTLILIYGFLNFQTLQELRTTPGENPFSWYSKGIEAIKNHELEKAKVILKKLLKSKDVQVKHLAIEVLAQIYFQENENEKAYELLLKADHQFLKDGKCLLCKLAFEQKNFALIGNYARDIYEIEPSFEIALLNSKAFACLDQPALAGAWLVTASQFGMNYQEKIQNALSGQVYDCVRGQNAFKQYAEKISVETFAFK